MGQDVLKPLKVNIFFYFYKGHQKIIEVQKLICTDYKKKPPRCAYLFLQTSKKKLYQFYI